jgi:hypothetical protein
MSWCRRLRSSCGSAWTASANLELNDLLVAETSCYMLGCVLLRQHSNEQLSMLRQDLV